MKIVLSLLWTAITIACTAQQNFTYSPENPKPGETITFSYEPAGNLAGNLKPVEASYFQIGKGMKADDIILLRQGKKFTGSFITDTAASFVFLSFSIDKVNDNNNNNGYYIHLYENNAVRKDSYLGLSLFYQFFGAQAGVERNTEKALAAYEKEFSLFPVSRKSNILSYVQLLASAKKEEATKIIQSEIEAFLKQGLKEESDYNTISNLYNMAKLPEQSKFFRALLREKIPGGNWVIADAKLQFYQEKDIEKKAALLHELESKRANDEKWKGPNGSIDNLFVNMAQSYISGKQWEKVKSVAQKIADKNQMSSVFNNAAWQMQLAGEKLELAEELSKIATDYAKAQWQKPESKKPDNLTASQWKKNNETTYAMYADTYAMIMYRINDFKKGYAFAKEAAFLINKGENADYNNTYALVSEKVLSAGKWKKEAEQFVKEGKSTQDIIDMLKKQFLKSGKTETDFENYIAALKKESYLKMVQELKKSMLNEKSPLFTLYNLDGNPVDIKELKGKVVVVDFWATWCGPCIASFPAMQKAVTKYKDNPDVRFLFINTWENVEKKTKVVKDFVTSKKYSFEVLMDIDNKVIEQFKVEGIPTKFVIDKSGNIRFKSVGFSGKDETLVDELSAMIDMVITQS